jgi:hypothetical protein
MKNGNHPNCLDLSDLVLVAVEMAAVTFFASAMVTPGTN